MWGYGAPDHFGQSPIQTPAGFAPGETGEVPVDMEYYDWGFGDPESNPLIDDLGFGDPVSPETIAPYLLDQVIFPDDGGEIVEVSGEWPIVGPYRVRLQQHYTAQLFPDTANAPGATAPILLDGAGNALGRGSPYWCYTGILPTKIGDVEGVKPDTTLRFILPPMPPGMYDIIIAWGTEIYPEPTGENDSEIVAHLFSLSVTMDKALRVIYRNRSGSEWNMRMSFPNHYTTGPRSSRDETILEGPG